MPEGYDTSNRERDPDIRERDVRRLDDQRTAAGRTAAEEGQRSAASREEEARNLIAHTLQTAGQVRHAVNDAVDAAAKLAYAVTDVQHMLQRSAIEAMFYARRQWWTQFTNSQS